MITEEELENCDTVEKLHFYLISPKDVFLTNRETQYLDNLTKAWSIIYDNPVRWKQVKLISEAVGCTMRHARNIVNDAEALFSPIFQFKEDIDKAFLISRYIRLAERSEELGDMDGAKKCYDSIAKMKGFFSQKEGISFDDLNLPDIKITSDPAVLSPPTEETEIEDATVEE